MDFLSDFENAPKDIHEYMAKKARKENIKNPEIGSLDPNLALPADFSLNFTYTSQLLFPNETVMNKTFLYWEKYRSHFPNKIWLGIYFQEAMKKRLFPSVEVRLTEERGYGLFAKEDIPNFTLIGEYTGLVRRSSLENPRKNLYLMRYPIGFWSLFSWVIDAKDQGNYCRWINHSQKKNADVKSFFYEGIVHLGIVSSEKIQKGREILIDYGELYWKKLKKEPIEKTL